MVIMPLVTGGALTALLARFGLRMPPSIERLVSIASRAVTGDTGGLVKEAVRMAGDYGGSGSASVHVRDSGRDMYYDGNFTNRGGGYGDRGYRRSRDSGGDGLGSAVAGMAKMFI